MVAMKQLEQTYVKERFLSRVLGVFCRALDFGDAVSSRIPLSKELPHPDSNSDCRNIV